MAQTTETRNELQARGLSRPFPPAEVIELGLVAPSSDLQGWIEETFVSEGSALQNPNHAHLQNARIGVLWHGEPLLKNGRQVIGRCELVQLTGDAWSAARKREQIQGWFGCIPDFILSFDAEWWRSASDAQACALTEHELSHAAQGRDKDGLPRFTQDGDPVYAIKGHDVEEFVDVVRRYGSSAAGVTELVAAANETPLMSDGLIGWACGSCGRAS